jgi:hypothetical protein
MRRQRFYLVAVVLCSFISGDLLAQPKAPAINTKRFAVDCQKLRGNTEKGLAPSRTMNSGFTIVLDDASHAFYNAPAKPALRYWVVPGDVALLNPKQKAVAAFASKKQRVQLYGGLEPGKLYTIFITHGTGKEAQAAARTVIKAHKCIAQPEPGIIPNELRKDRPLHLG